MQAAEAALANLRIQVQTDTLQQRAALAAADTDYQKARMQADMNEALKYAVNVQYPENVTLVTKYYGKLNAMMRDDE